MEIKIGHLTYNVIYADKSLMDAAHHYGRCCHDTQTITLSNSMSNERHAEVLLHEVIHAVFHTYNFHCKEEEKITTSLANGLSEVLNRNPELTELYHHVEEI